MVVTRRTFLCGSIAAVACGSVLEGPAWASMARAVSFAELVHTSDSAAVGTPVDAFCRWEQVAGRKRIVTYSVVDVERPIDGRSLPGGPIMVRTLGGIVGDLGQVVHGEAVLGPGQRTAMFLHRVNPDFFSVMAMSQGVYPIERDAKGVHRLRAHVAALELRGVADAAVMRLDGQSLDDAEALVAEELTRGSR
jgi:hypothetical protein